MNDFLKAIPRHQEFSAAHGGTWHYRKAGKNFFENAFGEADA